MQRKKHPCRRTPPAWVGRQDDGGNTRGGLLQAEQTHFTHTPTRGNTPLFAPAPSSDHGMRKLRGSVIRAARTTGQTQQQRFSHSAAPCQGSAHRRTLASLARSLRAIRPRPVSGASSSQPAVVERVCAAKRADGGQQQMLGCAPLACPALWANQSQTLQCRSPDAGSVGRAYDGWCFCICSHPRRGTVHTARSTHGTDLLLRTNSSNACGVTERVGRAGPVVSVAEMSLLLLMQAAGYDDGSSDCAGHAVCTVLLYVQLLHKYTYYLLYIQTHMTSERRGRIAGRRTPARTATAVISEATNASVPLLFRMRDVAPPGTHARGDGSDGSRARIHQQQPGVIWQGV